MIIRATGGQPETDLARALFREYEAELGIDLCFKGFEAELAGLPGDYAPPAGRLLLAWEGERLSGCVALRRIDAATCEMKRLYLRPDFRGEGRGRLLAVRIIEEARTIGYSKLRLETLPVMKAALGLYRSLGFQPVAAAHAPPGLAPLHLELDLRH